MVCKLCGKTMGVYDTVKIQYQNEMLTLRRRRCLEHHEEKCGTIERVASSEEDFKLMKLLSVRR